MPDYVLKQTLYGAAEPQLKGSVVKLTKEEAATPFWKDLVQALPPRGKADEDLGDDDLNAKRASAQADLDKQMQAAQQHVEKESKRMLDDAKAQAKQIVDDAKADAEAITKAAKADADKAKLEAATPGATSAKAAKAGGAA